MSPFCVKLAKGPIFPSFLVDLVKCPQIVFFLQKLHVAFYDDNFRAQRRVALCSCVCVCVSAFLHLHLSTP